MIKTNGLTLVRAMVTMLQTESATGITLFEKAEEYSTFKTVSLLYSPPLPRISWGTQLSSGQENVYASSRDT